MRNSGNAAGVFRSIVLVGVMWSTACHAAGGVAPDAHIGFFYAITHLNPIAYVVLFLVFVLSVLNLIVQGWLTRDTWPFNRILGLMGGTQGMAFGWPATRDAKRVRRETPYSPYPGGLDHTGGVVGEPRPVTSVDAGAKSLTPTPLDGLNHPVPKFPDRGWTVTGAPRIVEPKLEKKPHAQDFRFSAAVDVPPPEEVERREKEQLVVSGSVTGPDGRGIASAIVYLSDHEGNRMGQSCRTQPDTGEFKVLVNSPGRYFLNVYKRGFVLEGTEPMALPIHSGKIDGYIVSMIPEGCVIRGRVISDPEGEPLVNLEVRCIGQSGAFTRSARTDAEGRFKLSGIPVNCVCYVEAVGEDNSALARSKTFETVQKKEIHLDLRISAPRPTRRDRDQGWEEESAPETKHSFSAPSGA